MELIPANSVTFEIVHIMGQHCPCGGIYTIQSQHLEQRNGQPGDRIHAVCRQCGTTQDFRFDIHSFFGDPEGYQRFEATETALRAGLEAIHARRWDDAETQLRRVIDPQLGEPAFGWGHYHLGMTLLVQGKTTEGLRHLETAIHWNPQEAEFYRGLAKARHHLGKADAAATAHTRYLELQQRNLPGNTGEAR